MNKYLIMIGLMVPCWALNTGYLDAGFIYAESYAWPVRHPYCSSD